MLHSVTELEIALQIWELGLILKLELQTNIKLVTRD